MHLHFWSDSTSPDTDTGVQDYFIDGTKIAFHNSTKDLGLILSNNLDWTDHYHNITAKAYKVLGLLRCSFKTDSTDAKRKLYKDILLLERVQRRATKCTLNDYTSSYKSRLTKLNLLLLMYIFELNDLIFLSNPTNPFQIISISMTLFFVVL